MGFGSPRKKKRAAVIGALGWGLGRRSVAVGAEWVLMKRMARWGSASIAREGGGDNAQVGRH